MVLKDRETRFQIDFREVLLQVLQRFPATPFIIERLGKRDGYIDFMANYLNQYLEEIMERHVGSINHPKTEEEQLADFIVATLGATTNPDQRLAAWRSGNTKTDTNVRFISETRITGGKLEILATVKAIYDQVKKRSAIVLEGETSNENSQQVWRQFVFMFDQVWRTSGVMQSRKEWPLLNLGNGNVIRIEVDDDRKGALIYVGIEDDAEGTLATAAAKQESDERINIYERWLQPDSIVDWLIKTDLYVSPNLTLLIKELPPLNTDEAVLVINHLSAYDQWTVSDQVNPDSFRAIDINGRVTICFKQEGGGIWKIQIIQTEKFYEVRKSAQEAEILWAVEALVNELLEGATHGIPVVLDDLHTCYRRVIYHTTQIRYERDWGERFGITLGEMLERVHVYIKKLMPDEVLTMPFGEYFYVYDEERRMYWQKRITWIEHKTAKEVIVTWRGFPPKVIPILGN